MPRQCEGISRSTGEGRARCPYDALWEHSGSFYCAYHLAVVEGRIASAVWSPGGKPRPDAESNRERAEARERNPSDQLAALLAEWDLA